MFFIREINKTIDSRWEIYMLQQLMRWDDRKQMRNNLNEVNKNRKRN